MKRTQTPNRSGHGRVFVAEKPSVAKAIAAELGDARMADGYIACGATAVTWCFGHMLELAEPDAYTPDDAARTRAAAAADGPIDERRARGRRLTDHRRIHAFHLVPERARGVARAGHRITARSGKHERRGRKARIPGLDRFLHFAGHAPRQALTYGGRY